jgi:hypothetical protein
VIALLQQHERRKRSAVFHRRVREIFYNGFGSRNVTFDGRLVQLRVRIVIGFMPLRLHRDKNNSEVLDCRRKFLHQISVFALRFRIAMLQRSVYLSPCRFASLGSSAPNYTVRATSSQAVKHGVVSRANGSAQIGLHRLSVRSICEQFCGLDKIKRLQAWFSPNRISK